MKYTKTRQVKFSLVILVNGLLFLGVGLLKDNSPLKLMGEILTPLTVINLALILYLLKKVKLRSG